jgi:hypothetical protein
MDRFSIHARGCVSLHSTIREVLERCNCDIQFGQPLS